MIRQEVQKLINSLKNEQWKFDGASFCKGTKCCSQIVLNYQQTNEGKRDFYITGLKFTEEEQKVVNEVGDGMIDKLRLLAEKRTLYILAQL